MGCACYHKLWVRGLILLNFVLLGQNCAKNQILCLNQSRKINPRSCSWCSNNKVLLECQVQRELSPYCRAAFPLTWSFAGTAIAVWILLQCLRHRVYKGRVLAELDCLSLSNYAFITEPMRLLMIVCTKVWLLCPTTKTICINGSGACTCFGFISHSTHGFWLT